MMARETRKIFARTEALRALDAVDAALKEAEKTTTALPSRMKRRLSRLRQMAADARAAIDGWEINAAYDKARHGGK